LIGWLVR